MAGHVKKAPDPRKAVLPESGQTVGAKNRADLEAEARARAHVRQQMAERAIDQAEVSRMTGVNDGLLSRILNSDRGIGLGTLLKLCKGLKITPSRMLETDPPRKYWNENDPGRPEK